jgi:hypothetical protein
MAQISYKPLSIAQREIRILVISPRWLKGEKMNDVRGNISTSAHDDEAPMTTQHTTGLTDSLPEEPWDRAVTQLIDMGFSAEHSRQALLESGCSNSDNTFELDVAVSWILANPRPVEIPGEFFCIHSTNNRSFEYRTKTRSFIFSVERESQFQSESIDSSSRNFY